MNIPIELIVVFVGAFLTVLGFGFTVIWQNTNVLSSMKEMIAKITQEMGDSKESDKEKHEVIDKRLNEHSVKLQAHKETLIEHSVILKGLEK